MREGALLDKIQELLETASIDVQRRVIAHLADKLGLAPAKGAAGRGRRRSEEEDEDDDGDRFVYTSSFGSTETVDLAGHDRAYLRTRR